MELFGKGLEDEKGKSVRTDFEVSKALALFPDSFLCLLLVDQM